MGKHKNRTQNSIIIEFMEKYPYLAKGFTKRDKPTVDSLWQQLTESLNSAGPPQKDVNGWKKIWTEWKSEVKRKLAQNKAEARATGGGPYSKYQLTQTEENIVRLCSIATSVEGVAGISIGPNEEVNDLGDKEMAETSQKRPLPPHDTNNTQKRHRSENMNEKLKKFLDDDIERKVEITEKLDELVSIGKENASSLRRIYKAIDKSNDSVTNAISDLKNEFTRISAQFLETIKEKNELKKKQLELDLLKFDYERKRDGL